MNCVSKGEVLFQFHYLVNLISVAYYSSRISNLSHWLRKWIMETLVTLATFTNGSNVHVFTPYSLNITLVNLDLMGDISCRNWWTEGGECKHTAVDAFGSQFGFASPRRDWRRGDRRGNGGRGATAKIVGATAASGDSSGRPRRQRDALGRRIGGEARIQVGRWGCRGRRPGARVRCPPAAVAALVVHRRGPNTTRTATGLHLHSLKKLPCDVD